MNPNQPQSSFYQLLYAYGFPKTGEYEVTGSGTFAQMAGHINPTDSPIYLLRGGLASLGGGFLRNSMYDARYWSSVTSGAENAAYGLQFNSGISYPSRELGRTDGFSVRCVAR